MSLKDRPTSSPKLTRRSSRQSLGTTAEEEADKRPTPKRSISNLIANLREAQTTMEPIQEPIQLTAAQMAVEHFTNQLLAHVGKDVEAETVVILHDACYGHRYSRLKSTKSTLSMIVERPERIHASVLGASAAYVRLGGHHAGGGNAPSPGRVSASPPPFKIRRTTRSMDVTSSCVTNVHGTAWMAELKGLCEVAGERLATGTNELSRSSDPAEAEKRKLHQGDLYLCGESLDAFEGALGGVADAVDAVFQPTSATKRAFVAVRPPGHHCSADYPSGFCWLNNIHVSIEYAAQTYGLTHAAILDFDLHHGDGSQAITWQRNRANNDKRWNAKPNSKLKLNPDIGYYSLHDINSYPCEMGDDEKVQAASLCVENAHGQSIWNVHLQPWKTEEEFWLLYEGRYAILLEKARLFLRYHTARIKAEGRQPPRSAIFISAGFDASEWEGAGMQRHKVNVPTEFYARFSRDVVKLAAEQATGCEGRVISVLEGGYSDRALCSGVMSHLSGLCGQSLAEPQVKHALMNGLRLDTASKFHYNPSWWSAPNLTALELKVHPPPPPSLHGGKRVRTGPQPTYATPTESFAYKVVDPNKFARSVSGTMRDSPAFARPRTPPAPEVDWVVAVQELSRLLVPLNRTTGSCTAEELGGVRSKKERQSAAPVLQTTGGDEEVTATTTRPRQLRERKGKGVMAAGAAAGAGGSSYAGSTHSDDVDRGASRSASRASNGNVSRRQTLHDFPLASASASEEAAAASAGGGAEMKQRRMSRRLSAGSTLSSLDGGLDFMGQEVDRPPVPPLPVFKTPVPRASVAAGGEMLVKKTRASGRPKKLVVSDAPGAGLEETGVASATVSPANVVTAPVSASTQHEHLPSSIAEESPPSSSTTTTTNGTQLPPSAAPAMNQTANHDVDRLASGLKKISLNVGTREESERKVAEKEAAERRARALKGAETRRVNAAAKKMKAMTDTGGGNGGVNGAGSTANNETLGAVSTTSGLAPAATRTNGDYSVTGPGPASEQNLTSLQAEGGAPNSMTTTGFAPEPGLQGVRPDAVPSNGFLAQRGAPSAPADGIPDDRANGLNYEENLPPLTAASGIQYGELLSTNELDLSGVTDGIPEPTTAVKAPPQRPSHVVDALDAQYAAPTNGHHAPERPPPTSSTPSTMRSPAGKQTKTTLPIWNSTGPLPFASTSLTRPTKAATPGKSKTTSKSTAKSPAKSPVKSPKGTKLGPDGIVGNDGNGVSKTMLEVASDHEEEIVEGPTPGVEEVGDSVWAVPDTPVVSRRGGKM
ncbi:histone deacetylase [Recurvomyces mirabilis]|uniref:Histone deacetylase n=1 Tax=Recurvomyces mirabilis TaxID=574656 RepID=A0AAE0WJ39_9PEZI|nr:histone deacetylase [Recurvomyces mirabilis]KAK5150758.1 histone deacetylase [Recurvomyces mirabilis]